MSPRSYLFVPGDRPERFAKAYASGADAVVLDLEDAVPPERKALARQAIAEWLAACTPAQRAQTVLRCQAVGQPGWAQDLAVAQPWAEVAQSAPQLMLAKAESAEQMAQTQALCALPVLALIESAKGALAAPQIAAAPGVARLVFGTLDFALDLGVAAEPPALAHAASLLALASRAAGLPQPVAGVTTALQDTSALQQDWAWAASLGFGAKLCIHPSQVEPLHQAMRPTAERLAWAQRVLAAAAAAGGAACQVDGRMVDAPVIAEAQRLLARA